MKDKLILDANVPARAATAPDMCPEDELVIQARCMEYIHELIGSNTKLVLDADYEIIKEYRNNVNKTSNIGLLFLKWLDQYLGRIEMSNLVKLDKSSNGEYTAFPLDEETAGFDLDDRKYVAVANAHPEKPPIVEGTDGKWWGYINAFQKYGIRIIFLDEEYAQRMYQKKIVDKRRN